MVSRLPGHVSSGSQMLVLAAGHVQIFTAASNRRCMMPPMSQNSFRMMPNTVRLATDVPQSRQRDAGPNVTCDGTLAMTPKVVASSILAPSLRLFVMLPRSASRNDAQSIAAVAKVVRQRVIAPPAGDFPKAPHWREIAPPPPSDLVLWPGLRAVGRQAHGVAGPRLRWHRRQRRMPRQFGALASAAEAATFADKHGGAGGQRGEQESAIDDEVNHSCTSRHEYQRISPSFASRTPISSSANGSRPTIVPNPSGVSTSSSPIVNVTPPMVSVALAIMAARRARHPSSAPDQRGR